VAGTTTGAGCTLGAAEICEGDDILHCVTDSDSGCNIWQASTHCGNNTGGRLTCGSPGGTAKCVCPANGTTDEYVDPAAGSDAATGVVPTGIQLPANCRWGTLSKGLSVVPAAGRVIATSASAPVTFAGETFPLNVPAGVQLTTSDATPTPANYTINFNSGSAVNAVVLASGSTLQGYALTNTSGNAAASGIACSAGTATVNTVDIDGSGTTVISRGVDVTGSCAVSLNAVNLTSFTGVAINVNTSSTGSAISGGSATGATVGLRIQSGGVTATNFASNTNSTGGISLETGSPSLTLTGGTITENGVAGINVGKGTLTATSTDVNGNIGAGIIAAAGTTVSLTSVKTNSNGQGGAQDGIDVNGANLTSTNSQSMGNSRAGIVVTGAGTATLHGATIANNATRGVFQTGINSTVTIDQNSTIGPNTGSGVESTIGTLTINGGSEVKNNGIHGVTLMGAIATINAVKIHNNTGNGIFANSSNVVINIGLPGQVTEVSANGAHGIRIDAAALTPSNANPVTMDTVHTFGNGLTGIFLAGTSGDVAATIQNTTVNGNGDTGVLVEQVGGTTRSFFQTNDVFSNNTNDGHTTGGILFNTSSTLQTFIANKIHSNGGDELGFNALPNGGTNWSITTASGMCDAQSNSLYCYGAGKVGLRVIPPSVATVNAQRVHWVNIAPTFNVDYSAALAPQVDVTNACSIIATCP
jgi:hypothetical protein